MNVWDKNEHLPDYRFLLSLCHKGHNKPYRFPTGRYISSYLMRALFPPTLPHLLMLLRTTHFYHSVVPPYYIQQMPCLRLLQMLQELSFSSSFLLFILLSILFSVTLNFQLQWRCYSITIHGNRLIEMLRMVCFISHLYI